MGKMYLEGRGVQADDAMAARLYAAAAGAGCAQAEMDLALMYEQHPSFTMFL
jgi:TPR repeat protein